jgi:aminocarboxymuconate-semialdehyde decarboxylase
MKIDVFCHILPKRYKEELYKRAPSRFYSSKYADAVQSLSDLDARFRIMDRYEEYVQVLSMGSPPPENVLSPSDAKELCKIGNDEMAELVFKHPDRFVAAVASLPMNDVDASLEEIDRAIKDLRFRGIQIFTDINQKPLDNAEFLPIYERMQYHNLPILLHPRRQSKIPDYEGESESKYLVWTIFGWPYETSVAMTRLVFGGILEKVPNLKVISHHAGGMIPYFAKRIQISNNFNEMRLGYKYEEHLTKSPLDYYRMFYNDTAVYGNTAALMCAYAFFGADNLLFATDMPYDNQLGNRFISETIRSIDEMAVSVTEKKKIFEENARKILRLPT